MLSQRNKSSDTMKAAIDLLLGAQNEDGGWGSVKGKHSNTEATAFALMALKSMEKEKFNRQVTAGLNWLLKHQKDRWKLAFEPRIETEFMDNSDCGSRVIIVSGSSGACLECCEMGLGAGGKKAWVDRIRLVAIVSSEQNART